MVVVTLGSRAVDDITLCLNGIIQAGAGEINVAGMVCSRCMDVVSMASIKRDWMHGLRYACL